MTAQDGSITTTAPELSSNEIFISYCRRDKDFVVKLDQALRKLGYDPWVDWSDIQPAEDWWLAIERGIEAASTFIFVISPDSVASTVCRKEIEHGLRHNKRVVPLLWREGFGMEDVHPIISRHNWIFCRETDSFEQAFDLLINTIKTDLDHVRTHTRLLVRAKEWEHKLCDTSFLLRGSDLRDAEHWLDQSNGKHPQPIDLHCRYIQASRADEQARQDVELRLRRMSPQQFRNRQTLLNKVRNYWIKEVLENSLHDRVLMELGLVERMDAVAPPWYLSAETPDPTPEPFPEGTRITALFDQLGEGRTLLILGEPGVGKTTTLLTLARDLVTRAEQGLDDRIPVVFNLSSWAERKQPIDEWLIHELNTKYQIPTAVGKNWVETQQLLLMLDGLDEVKAENQDACVLALNLFQQQYGAEMVVCCRVHDYEVLKHRLHFQQAILVRSLTLEQIHQYLDNAGTDMTALKTLLEQDVVLQELAQSPLMLNIMTLVYQGKRVADLPSLNLEEQRQYLFNSFIDRMLQRRGSGDRQSGEQVIHYLVWLSQHMVQESHSVFLIEDLQPNWLSTPSAQRLYRVIVMGVVGLVFGVVMGLFARILNYDIGLRISLPVGIIAGILSGITTGFLPQLKSSQSFGILAAVVSGLIYGITGRLFDSVQPLNMSIFGLVFGIILMRLHDSVIEPADAIQWSWTKGKKTFQMSAAWGLLAGGALLITRWLILPPDFLVPICNNNGASESLVKWTGSVLVNFICQDTKAINLNMLLGLLALGLFVGCQVSLALGFKKIPKVESRTAPNHGIWKSTRNAVTLVVISGFLSALASMLIWLLYFLTAADPGSGSSEAIASQVIWWIHYGSRWPEGLIFGVSVGVFLGGISGLVGGDNSGLMALQHAVLRVMLWKGGHTPWNYARFLNNAADRVLLKRIGGGYIFIHRLLLEHFAQHMGKRPPGRSPSKTVR